MKLNLARLKAAEDDWLAAEDDWIAEEAAAKQAALWQEARELCAQAREDTTNIDWVPALMYNLPCAIEAQGLVATRPHSILVYEMLWENEKDNLLVEVANGAPRQPRVGFFTAEDDWLAAEDDWVAEEAAAKQAALWQEARELCAQAREDTPGIAWVPALLYNLPCAIEAQGWVAIRPRNTLVYRVLWSNERANLLVGNDKGTPRQPRVGFFTQSPWD